MNYFTFLADKETHVRSEDYGRDLSSVQTLLTKQVSNNQIFSSNFCNKTS